MLRSNTTLKQMDNEKLIDLVRKYEFLYNLKHIKYMDSSRKEIAWKEIAGQMQQSAAACKERWQSLRDAYRRALGKKRGKPITNIKPWKYENEMAFVAPFIVKRKTQSSENRSEGEESDNCADYSTDQYNSLVPYEMQESVEVKIEDVESDNHSVETAYNSNNYYSESNDTELKGRGTKRKMIESEQTGSAVSRSLTDRYRPEGPRENELDGFFLTISDTVKKFSPYLQALAKNKIFNLVSEMELQLLQPPTSSTTSTQ